MKDQQNKERDIAIIGMAGIFPGAGDLNAFWKNILHKACTVREVDPERWRVEHSFDADPRCRDKIYSKWGGFLDPVFFNPALYGIPPVSLKAIEAVQLLALEIVRSAIEDTGIRQADLPGGRTAVIFGAGGMHDQCIDYIFRTMLMHYFSMLKDSPDRDVISRVVDEMERRLPEWTEDSLPGMLGNIVSGRVANRFDLMGSNYTVDAACASSLAALDVGMAKLRSGQADMAIVGAVDLSDNVMGFTAFAKTFVLSPTGTSCPFDDNANGIVISEGVSALVLKRLSDASQEGDRIRAVIKGIGSSSDGRNRSLTAPHPQGQVMALERAYADAGIDPSDVGLIEAHGTGTVVGDRSEVESLSRVFGRERRNGFKCALGSVKSNIGHAKIAAGLAGVVKCVLALENMTIPPTIGITQPNRRIDFDRTPFYLNTESRPWFASSATPRRCGISAFGFGGTNFHTVLEEYPEREKRDPVPTDHQIFVFSGPDGKTLANGIYRVLQRMAAPGHIDCRALAAALYHEFKKNDPTPPCRLCITASSGEELKEKLGAVHQRLSSGRHPDRAEGVYYGEKDSAKGRVCFLFPGQGSQKINMFRDLLIAFPEWRKPFEQADELLTGLLGNPLSEIIFPAPTFSAGDRKQQAAALNDTQAAQPALAAADLFALELLTGFNIHADFVAGHSFGEYAALCAAGVFSSADLIQLAFVRGKISREASEENNGKMAAVKADADTVNRLIVKAGSTARAANLNAPDQTVISGSEPEIDKCLELARGEKIHAVKIPVTVAFHTEHMMAAADKLAPAIEKIRFAPARLPVYGNTTGGRYPKSASEMKKMLCRHLRKPLDFVSQVHNLYDAGARLFIEAGPGKVLTKLVKKILEEKTDAVCIALDGQRDTGIRQLALLLSEAMAAGLPVDLTRWFGAFPMPTGDVEKVFKDADDRANPPVGIWRIAHGKVSPADCGKSDHAAGKNRDLHFGQGHVATQGATGMKSPDNTASIKASTVTPPNKEGTKKQIRMMNSKQEDQKNVDTRIFESMIPRIQENLDHFMELQRGQQRLMERFLEMQNQLMTVVLNGNALLAGDIPPASETLTDIEKDTRSAKIGVPPAPVLPELTAKMSEGMAPSFSTPPPPKIIPSATSGSVGDPLSVEQFQEDLLNIVSELTGYPQNMLGLDAHLEADLGIDSIKRVEIFSRLTEHHQLLESRDEEMVLEELADLKSLRKIIDWYDANRTRLLEDGEPTPKKS